MDGRTTRSLILPAGGTWHLRRLANAAAPAEACGLLVGRLGAVADVVEVPNVAVERSRFEMDPDELLGVLLDVDEAGREVVGAWHSHPGGSAEPSAADVAGAVPGWAMVIVGARDVRAWQPGDGRPTELRIIERTW